MANVKINLSYPHLSTLLQQEINKQNINVKGYDIAIEKLVMNSEEGKLRVTGMINSKWDAYFDFSALPIFHAETQQLELQDISLDLDAQNLIFKGILKLAKGNVKNRIEKQLEKPLTQQLESLKSTLDAELAKAPLPYNLKLTSNTSKIDILKIDVLSEKLVIDANVEQNLIIQFNEEV